MWPLSKQVVLRLLRKIMQLSTTFRTFSSRFYDKSSAFYCALIQVLGGSEHNLYGASWATGCSTATSSFPSFYWEEEEGTCKTSRKIRWFIARVSKELQFSHQVSMREKKVKLLIVIHFLRGKIMVCTLSCDDDQHQGGLLISADFHQFLIMKSERLLKILPLSTH